MKTLRAMPRGVWRRLSMFAALFALLFSLIAVTEYIFARHEIAEDLAATLRSTVDEATRTLNYTGRWDLTKYRQADFQVTQYFVLTADNLLVDVQGFAPGFIRTALPVDDSIYAHPKMVRTSVGETWLLYGRRIAGGFVILGMLDSEALKDPNKTLETELAKFGPTLREALKVKASDISNYINAFAVLDDFGEVQSALGGIPLKVKLNITSNIPSDHVYTVRLSGKDYAVWSHPIRVGMGNPVALILAFDDIGDLSKVLSIYKRFNVGVGSASWAVAVLSAATFLIVGEVRRRKQEMTLEEALKTGEGQAVEFKAGIIDRMLANTIAAFANTNPGNIFLGVNDNAEVVGLDEDAPKDREQLQQKIRNLTAQVVRPAVFVRLTFIRHGVKIVLRIFVPRGNEPVYLVDGVAYIRYMAAVVKAGPEELQAIIRGWRRGA